MLPAVSEVTWRLESATAPGPSTSLTLVAVMTGTTAAAAPLVSVAIIDPTSIAFLIFRPAITCPIAHWPCECLAAKAHAAVLQVSLNRRKSDDDRAVSLLHHAGAITISSCVLVFSVGPQTEQRAFPVLRGLGCEVIGNDSDHHQS